ncbi:MipA/OmpV family protein [Pseudoalteromonas sp. JBTF-M23]|uniref:MipA/OmpV family protein n=1 Tax=Pseudoalteromonas caenipelagi TaxID=2726988 RepID=A0A849VEN3_9GAMM|nr:MipA/OmpV family protein [Pseudoalteromonas caenipelagi]NOU50394.1 MipA/OmpV family protein [Pseudoalteromonas caenipelagi]
MKQVLLAVSFMLTLQANAQSCEPKSTECVAVGQWQFSVAIGAGVMTNPLFGGENIPLVVIPYISYYRDRFFWDNTTLGYTLSNTKHFDISVVIEPNAEQAYFERFHVRNLIAPESYFDASGTKVDSGILPDGTSSEGDLSPITPRISIDDISKRKWTIDGGVLAHWYVNEGSKFTFSWLKDFKGVYKGQHSTLSYSQKVPLPEQLPAKLQLKLGAHWQSRQLVDYYYGLRSSDSKDPRLYYQGKSTVSPFVALAFNYRLSEKWQLKVSAKHKFLGSGISDSPLLKHHNTSSVFVGGLYEF